jgi:O-antigen ligase
VAPVLVALVFALEHRRPLAADHARPSVPHHGRYRVRLLLTVAAVLLLLGSQWHLVQTRANEAWQEVQLHQTTGASDNSIGQRLAHWKFAWRMGLAKPWTGWGEQGYQIEKNAQAERGDIPHILHEFEHAHNEWLDMWAKRGTVGVLVLVLFFALPGHLYWRTWRLSAMQPPTTPWPSAASTSALCGLVMVAGYVGFGLTQVMFAHNAGTMMYLFMNLLWLAPIAQASAEQRHRHGEQPQRQVDADPQPNAGQ